MTIRFSLEPELAVAEYAAILRDAAPALNRPVDDPARLETMLRRADLVVTARDAGDLVGLARCLTDYAWTCYCAELAVAGSHRGRGIGQGLIRYCRAQLGPDVSFNLLSVPSAVGFYERMGGAMGMRRAANAFYIERER